MTLEIIATQVANEHLNLRCQHMEMQDKLLRWQEMYDTALAALRLYEAAILEQHREAMAYVSNN